MEESILNSIKKLLGISEDYNDFDPDIIMAINATFPTLAQIGLGSDEGFMITDETTTWNEYLEDNMMLNNVKMYMYIKTKLVFDPPSSSIVLEALKENAKEYEWRIQLYSDKSNNEDTDEYSVVIVRGSNDPIILEVPEQTSNIVNASAAIIKNGVSLKTWSFDEMQFGNNVIILPLSEDDTLAFTTRSATLEIKWKTEGGRISLGDTVHVEIINRSDTTRL